MRTERCPQAVTYLRFCQYINYSLIILEVKVPYEYVASVAYEHCPDSIERVHAASIVSGKVCGHFHGCWHERFNIYSVNLLQVR